MWDGRVHNTACVKLVSRETCHTCWSAPSYLFGRFKSLGDISFITFHSKVVVIPSILKWIQFSKLNIYEIHTLANLKDKSFVQGFNLFSTFRCGSSEHCFRSMSDDVWRTQPVEHLLSPGRRTEYHIRPHTTVHPGLLMYHAGLSFHPSSLQDPRQHSIYGVCCGDWNRVIFLQTLFPILFCCSS